jgi:hypothetical protein
MAFTTAGAANPLLLIQAGLAWAGFAFALMGAMHVATLQEQLDSETARMQSSMNQLASSFQGLFRGLGGS